MIGNGGYLKWQDDALCAQIDTEAFHVEKGGSSRPAKKICDMCTVTEECLDYALEHNIQDSIWGGKTARERHNMRMGRTAVA